MVKAGNSKLFFRKVLVENFFNNNVEVFNFLVKIFFLKNFNSGLGLNFKSGIVQVLVS